MTVSQNAIRYPRDVAPELRAAMTEKTFWKTLRQQEAAGSPVAAISRQNMELTKPLPTEAETAALLDVAFAASLLEEEGRRPQFTLAFVTPEGAEACGLRILRFEQPLPMTPEKLVKIAPAVHPDQTLIAVERRRDWQLCVWGLVHQGDPTFSIDLEHRAPFFCCRVLRPGSFTVHYGQRLLLLFSRDHWHLFDEHFDLTGTLRDGAKLDGAVAHELTRLAQRMLDHGHGGTILIVDDAWVPTGVTLHPSFTVQGRASTILKDAFALDASFDRGDLPRGGMTDAQLVRHKLELERAHDDALDFVAQLTAVDGAVILRSDLTLLGFGGSILTGTELADPAVDLEDPREPGAYTRTSATEFPGNRHRSAVYFCAQQGAGFALALVASQDGDLSLFGRRADGVVHAIRPFELGVGT